MPRPIPPVTLTGTHIFKHRNHMLMLDGSTRSTVWCSIVGPEWPAVKANLAARLAAPSGEA